MFSTRSQRSTSRVVLSFDRRTTEFFFNGHVAVTRYSMEKISEHTVHVLCMPLLVATQVRMYIHMYQDFI